MLNKAKNNATCAICGKEYEMCYSCKDAKKSAPWKLHCDTAEHYKVYQIVNGYTSGIYTKDEALDRLKNVDLSDMSAFRAHIKSIVVDILHEDNNIESDVDGNVVVDSKAQKSEKNDVANRTVRRSRKIVSRQDGNKYEVV